MVNLIFNASRCLGDLSKFVYCSVLCAKVCCIALPLPLAKNNFIPRHDTALCYQMWQDCNLSSGIIWIGVSIKSSYLHEYEKWFWMVWNLDMSSCHSNKLICLLQLCSKIYIYRKDHLLWDPHVARTPYGVPVKSYFIYINYLSWPCNCTNKTKNLTINVVFLHSLWSSNLLIPSTQDTKNKALVPRNPT